MTKALEEVCLVISQDSSVQRSEKYLPHQNIFAFIFCPKWMDSTIFLSVVVAAMLLVMIAMGMVERDFCIYFNQPQRYSPEDM